LISPAEFLSEKGYKHVRPVAAYCEKYEPILDQIHKGDADLPIVLRGFSKDWPACHKWEEQYFLARWGGLQVTPSIALPAHGVPYLISDAEVRQKMSLTEYWQELTKKGRCYIDQHPLSIFPGLADDCHITELMGRKEYIVLNLWLGRETKSGLHLDYADNFIIMVRGKKLAVLARSEETSRLYPFIDVTTKSQLDVENPDFIRFPKVTDVDFVVTELFAGDVLYIPMGWWHYLSSPSSDYSISVNCWWRGRPEPSVSSRLRRTFKLGPKYVSRLARDFIVHGVGGRPFTQRNYSPPPDGVLLFGFILGLFTKRS
jgi:hypothetical protein